MHARQVLIGKLEMDVPGHEAAGGNHLAVECHLGVSERIIKSVQLLGCQQWHWLKIIDPRHSVNLEAGLFRLDNR
jgi:hypothetical protein